ncbi:MAG TPA: SDR family oxidoreductase [Armatimonadota bacterium]|nr:SDR family oxidoreductase [Armatimonadota bacterium]
MVILVTGATGTIGSQVVQFLVEKDVQIRAAVHTPEKAAALRRDHIEVVPFDYANNDVMEAALQGVDKVFLLTPAVLEGGEMARNAIDIMRRQPITQLVRLSVLNADREPSIRITRAHREVEQYIEMIGIPHTFLRPNSFMENLLSSADTIRQQGVLYSPMADARVSYIAARDIGKVAAEVLTTDGHLGKSYDLTGPTALSGGEIASAVSDTINRPVEYIPISDEMMHRALADTPEEYVEQLLELNASYRAGAGERVSNTVRDLTGRNPMTMREWLRFHAASFRPGEARAA